MEAACVLEKKQGERKSCIVSRKLGKKDYVTLTFALYDIPLILPKKMFSLAKLTLTGLHSITQLEIRACNVTLYQPHLHFLIFLCLLFLTVGFQNALKYAQNRIKLRIKCPKSFAVLPQTSSPGGRRGSLQRSQTLS